MKRRIIQIAAHEVDESAALYALCNDGSVWFRWRGGPWEREDPIPQHGATPYKATCSECVFWKSQIDAGRGNTSNFGDCSNPIGQPGRGDKEWVNEDDSCEFGECK